MITVLIYHYYFPIQFQVTDLLLILRNVKATLWDIIQMSHAI